ncbi:broad-complex core protein isoforms 1/2/3/4/5-like isoform X2 [Ischnura elegans]|nr:broad-complex core protein isoforms 1/2/3/4/5-like isoform X2 [Ischnura elegans]XP_046394219.1 broad-complex core protein isoforms 1/2/3/4/5-like isoform X2 [Ischnura elegans]
MATDNVMTTRQIFNLRWNNHSNNMLQVFLDQLASEALVDVTLSCEGKFLKVHRMVLSACSPYFQDLFSYHKEQNPVIIVNGMKFSHLKSVVSFMYCGEIEVAEQEMEGVLAVAEALEVKGLSDVRGSYENRHKKSSASDKEHSESESLTNEVAGSGAGSSGRYSRGHTGKKRKFSEAGQNTNPVVGKATQVGDNCVSNSANLLVVPDEESCSNHPQDIHVKEEIRDSDGEVTIGSGECADSNSSSGNGLSPLPKTLSVKEGNPVEVSSEVSLATATEVIPNRHELPKAVGPSTVLQKICEEVDPVLPLKLGNTARKTMFSQGRCKIPRPPNAFMVFANEWRRKLAILHHGETNKDISVRLGAMWKELPADAKESYFAAARRADQEHKIRYPGYIYSPKEARIRKVLRQIAVKKNSGYSHMSLSAGPDLTSREVVQSLTASSNQE